MTATRHVRFRATTHVEPTEPPRYIPPALRHDMGTHHCSFKQNPWSQNFRRDPPPHKDTPIHSPRPSDSLNWRAPSPNHPASFRSLLPPPQSPPTPPISPICPNIPPMPLKNLTGSQLTSNLVSLIKTTSEALQSIVRIAERLLHQANAERRLAHKSRQMAWSLHEDALGNMCCSQPPTFPSGRGVPAAGSPAASDSIA
jgi:hypothetical protein